KERLLVRFGKDQHARDVVDLLDDKVRHVGKLAEVCEKRLAGFLALRRIRLLRVSGLRKEQLRLFRVIARSHDYGRPQRVLNSARTSSKVEAPIARMRV